MLVRSSLDSVSGLSYFCFIFGRIGTVLVVAGLLVSILFNVWNQELVKYSLIGQEVSTGWFEPMPGNSMIDQKDVDYTLVCLQSDCPSCAEWIDEYVAAKRNHYMQQACDHRYTVISLFHDTKSNFVFNRKLQLLGLESVLVLRKEKAALLGCFDAPLLIDIRSNRIHQLSKTKGGT